MVKAHEVLNSIKKYSLLKTSKLNHTTIQEENEKEKIDVCLSEQTQKRERERDGLLAYA